MSESSYWGFGQLGSMYSDSPKDFAHDLFLPMTIGRVQILGSKSISLQHS